MEKLLICCLSILLLSACQKKPSFYKKEFSEAEKLELAEKLLDGLGYRFYYQGSVGEQFLLQEAEKYNPEHAEVWREKGIPYLKRGIAWGYKPNYNKAAELDPEGWQGYKAYCTLYFYRDYAWALKDIDELDALTPDFTDYPQATSVDYMRGICYLGLEQPEQALFYIDKHIESEAKKVGYDYIYPTAYVIKGIAQKKLGQLDKAQATFEFGIKHLENNAEVEYQLAKLLHEQEKNEKSLKWLQKAKQSFQEGNFTSRPYVAEFYQVYLEDLEELELRINSFLPG